MKARFLLPAQQELWDAVRYYNLQRAGLGQAFREEALETLQRVLRLPNAWHPLSSSIRRCQMRRFPYGLIYAADDHEIVVIAVAHLHREPEYWRGRRSV